MPLTHSLCSILAGLVAVTSGCSVVEPWAGIIIGVGERSIALRAWHAWMRACSYRLFAGGGGGATRVLIPPAT